MRKLRVFDLNDIIEHLNDDGISGVTTDIIDYDWNDDDVRCEGAARVTIWLKREVTND